MPRSRFAFLGQAPRSLSERKVNEFSVGRKRIEPKSAFQLRARLVEQRPRPSPSEGIWLSAERF